MNRKNLTAAVLAGLAGVAGIAGTAQAVNINPDGTGQVLLYPYYTTNDGNQTLISVVNTTDQAKAVKVRFLEGFNSREVLDFNLYMSREDVWVAALADSSAFGAAAGVPHLFTNDSSCTVPYLYEMASTAPGLQAFLNFAYAGDNNDGGPESIARAAEGYVEMIEMGTLVDDGTYDFATAVTHGSDRMPADCAALTTAWTEVVNDLEGSGIWVQESQDDVGLPDQAETGTSRNSGGLFGGAAIVNADNGTMFSYDAKAIQGFNKGDTGLHFRPGTIYPSLESGDELTAYVFFGVPQNQAVPVTYSDYSVDAVSAVFMHDFIMNEYVVAPSLNAGTEWVINFPTKNFYVDPDRMTLAGIEWPTTGDCSDDPPEDAAPCDNFARQPFTELFGAVDGDDQALCEVVSIQTWDREEQTFEPTDPDSPVIPPVVSPSVPPEFGCDDFGNCPTFFQLCNEVNVLRFGDESVFGTPVIEGDSLLVEVCDEFTSGWGRINLTENTRIDQMRTDSEGLVGMPVTGFAAYEFENGFLDGGSVKANYGGLFGHKASVRSSSVAAWPQD
ncbi:MAG: hypothetical protein KJO70_09755 [Gammaproteobacteria bacterium]|nr:hypothetical protein [Gammaproteobacteria bacterium]